jgi:eukaryotic-like serine/threonine-protein kinase
VQTGRPIELLAGRYALEEELGRSGSGVLWQARDTVLERPVAVKILRPELADQPSFAERFAEETRIVAGVASARLAELLDTGPERGITYLIREHVPGQSLRAHLRRHGPLPSARAARVVAGLLDALAPAHRAGALHLDLKPENVILSPEGEVTVTDLGIGATVRAACSGREAAEVLSPTVDPPELRNGGTPDRRTDVYLAGAVLFEALTGRAPEAERPLPGSIQGAPKALDAALARALAPNPDDRPEDAAAFAAALRTVAEQAPAEGGPDERTRRTGRSGLRGWLLVPTLIAAAAVATIIAGLSLGRLEFGGPLVVRPAE